jgi:hypothetical protein
MEVCRAAVIAGNQGLKDVENVEEVVEKQRARCGAFTGSGP